MRREHARSTRTATPLRLFHATILRKSPFCERHGARARCAPPHAWAPPLPVRVPKGRSVEPQRAPLRVLDVAPTWHPRGTHVDRGGSHLLAAACRFAPAPSSLDLRSISARSRHPLPTPLFNVPPGHAEPARLPVSARRASPHQLSSSRGVPLPTSSRGTLERHDGAQTGEEDTDAREDDVELLLRLGGGAFVLKDSHERGEDVDES